MARRARVMAAIVLALSGCQLVLPLHHETDGGSAEGGGVGDASCNAATTMNPACNACLDQYCCTETAHCEANAACTSLGQCAAFCVGSTPCIDNCKSMYPAGQSDYDTFIACTAMHCASTCSN